MSKGLEALERIGQCYVNSESKDLMFTDEYGDDYDIIEKELKVLEIIKNKRVDVFELLLGISNSVYRNPLERYNSYVEGSFNTELTPQEFDLLKEVLEE